MNLRHGAGGMFLLAASVGGIAHGQAPTIEIRTLFTTAPAGGAPVLPSDGLPLNTVFRFGDGHALICKSRGRAFIADGASLREVMIPGSPVAGASDGRTWIGSSDEQRPIPLDACGALFCAVQQTDAGHVVGWFVGDPDGPLASLPLPLGTLRSTPSGLTYSFPAEGLVAGPLGGPMVMYVPNPYQPPEFPSAGNVSYNDGGHVFLNSRGVMAVPFRYSFSGRYEHSVLVVDGRSIRVAAVDHTQIQTDRGPLTIGDNILPASQPLDDGSVLISSADVRIGGVGRSGLWFTHPSGPASVVALPGDRAVGTTPGVRFAQNARIVPLGVNRSGSVLFHTTLEGPGVTASNFTAVYLWKSGSLTLIFRQRPGASVVLPPYQLKCAATINEHDEVGLVFADRSALLYRPGAGTRVVAAAGSRLDSSAGLDGAVTGIGAYYSESCCGYSGDWDDRWFGGRDDNALPCLGEHGDLFFTGTARVGAGNVNFAATARLADDGCPADFNGDGIVDFFDYEAFLACFEGGACPDGRPADFNLDGFADFFDYLDFVDAFEAGC